MADRRAPLAGRRILLLPRYGDSGPSSRLRMTQFVPRLAAAGATVTISPFFGEDYLAGYFATGRKPKWPAAQAFARRFAALAGARADLMWVEKELFPFLPGTFERLRGTPYVVDYDDAIFHGYDLSRSGVVRRLLGRKLDPLLRRAAAVTAGNQYLLDYAVAHGAQRVVQVPTVVDPARYPDVPPAAGGRLRVGWIGTPANARYLTPVVAALAMLAERLPLTLVTIGAPALPGLPVPQEAHSWREATEAALLATVDVGVMPLPDTPFERGKCGYKLIQYLAAGRPVVASPVGVNRDIVDDDVGLLAATPAEWADAIAALAADPARRAAMGAAGRRRVAERYSIDAVAPGLIALFAELAR